MSTFHWMPLVNGYSGFFPAVVYQPARRLAPFPDFLDRVSAARDNVAVIVHDDGYGRAERLRIVDDLMQSGLKWLADYDDRWGSGTLSPLELRH
jgi:hypothetical protein